jgi:hypothetical protein
MAVADTCASRTQAPCRRRERSGNVGDDTFNAALGSRWDRPCLLRVSEDTQPRTVTGMHNLTMRCRPADQVDALVFGPTVTPVRS